MADKYDYSYHEDSIYWLPTINNGYGRDINVRANSIDTYINIADTDTNEYIQAFLSVEVLDNLIITLQYARSLRP